MVYHGVASVSGLYGCYTYRAVFIYFEFAFLGGQKICIPAPTTRRYTTRLYYVAKPCRGKMSWNKTSEHHGIREQNALGHLCLSCGARGESCRVATSNFKKVYGRRSTSCVFVLLHLRSIFCGTNLLAIRHAIQSMLSQDIMQLNPLSPSSHSHIHSSVEVHSSMSFTRSRAENYKTGRLSGHQTLS